MRRGWFGESNRATIEPKPSDLILKEHREAMRLDGGGHELLVAVLSRPAPQERAPQDEAHGCGNALLPVAIYRFASVDSPL
jgi:hypothetical protein